MEWNAWNENSLLCFLQNIQSKIITWNKKTIWSSSFKKLISQSLNVVGVSSSSMAKSSGINELDLENRMRAKFDWHFWQSKVTKLFFPLRSSLQNGNAILLKASYWCDAFMRSRSLLRCHLCLSRCLRRLLQQWQILVQSTLLKICLTFYSAKYMGKTSGFKTQLFTATTNDLSLHEWLKIFHRWPLISQTIFVSRDFVTPKFPAVSGIIRFTRGRPSSRRLHFDEFLNRWLTVPQVRKTFFVWCRIYVCI